MLVASCGILLILGFLLQLAEEYRKYWIITPGVVCLVFPAGAWWFYEVAPYLVECFEEKERSIWIMFAKIVIALLVIAGPVFLGSFLGTFAYRSLLRTKNGGANA